ncbi:DUF552 domain-containing protein [Candidatus Woesearchaeota archaeon]|nr:DUF552 domain-containing protein [Candidatus Woesearchaeota archaeon]
MSNWGDVKKKLGSMFASDDSNVELGEDYVELEADLGKELKSKVLVKPFTLNKYEDVKAVLNAVREGRTISILNIAPLKEKDLTELKRAIDKVKKTVDASEGDIAGFGENWLIVTPSFAKVWRKPKAKPQPENLEDAPKPQTF